MTDLFSATALESHLTDPRLPDTEKVTDLFSATTLESHLAHPRLPDSVKHIPLITSLLALLPGCTSVRVQAVDAGLDFRNVCIEENTRTTVEDFLPVVRDGFRRNGIPTRVVAKPAPKECEFVLTYVAYKEYDGFAPYLDHAELKVEKDGKVVASAVYHLIGGGGMSLMKWESTKTKMDPVVDRLLANVRR